MICSALLCATEHAYPQPVCWLPFVKVQAMQIHFTTFIYSNLVYPMQCESYNAKSLQLDNTMRVYIARTYTLWPSPCWLFAWLCVLPNQHTTRALSALNPSQHVDHMHRLLLCKISNISSYELKPVHQIRVAAFQ